MLIREGYESDKDTEKTLCGEKVEFEVSGVVPPGAIVYCDNS